MTRDEVARIRIEYGVSRKQRKIGYCRKHRAKKALAANPGDPSIALLRPRHAGEVEARVALVREAKQEKADAGKCTDLTTEELAEILPA